VIIVGGGIIGCSIAYFLSKKGIRSMIIERDAVGSQASGAAAGIITPLRHVEPGSSLMEMTLKSFRMHEDFQREIFEETGRDVHYRRLPIFFLAFTEEEEKELKSLMLPEKWAVSVFPK